MFGRGKRAARAARPAVTPTRSAPASRSDPGALTRQLAEATPELDRVAAVVADAAQRVGGAGGGLWILDPASRRVVDRAVAGSGLDGAGLGERLLEALQPGRHVVLDERILALAIEVRGRLAAVVATARTHTAPSFEQADVAGLRDLAQQAALAVDNARLYRSSMAETAERRRVESNLRNQAVQQAALAELSQRALAGADPADLLRDTVVVVAQTLDVPVVGMVEVTGDGLVVRAGVGQEGGGGPAGHALAAAAVERDEPVVVDGPEAAAAVPVRSRFRPFGALEVHARDRAFVPEDVGFLQAVANVVALAVERATGEAEIRHQALHDTLTGLPNRALLGDRLDHAIHAFRRERRPLALLLMDLDGFKEINDTLGHHTGDLVLSTVGSRLSDVVRQSDTVARLGGDEFAMVLLGVDRDEAKGVADKVLAAVEQPLEIDGVSLRPRASIGISLAPRHGADAATLLRCADVAMYRAKQLAQGCAIYDSSYDHHDVRRLALAGELREAIEGGQLVCHYQPIVDLTDRGVVSVEALVRWQHPVLGLVRPDHFIPLAEETGLIRPLTWWVLTEAIQQARRWDKSGAPVSVAVNISARMLHDPELVTRVADGLRAAGLHPGRLALEITESGVMANPGAAQDTIRALAELGVGLAIDDFGTGYSSLAYLQRLPVQKIKVDRSFVTTMLTNRNDASIVRSVIELGHSLGLAVVAEGVEAPAVADLLTKLGCDAAQGYHLGLPVPAAELGRLAAAG